MIYITHKIICFFPGGKKLERYLSTVPLIWFLISLQTLKTGASSTYIQKVFIFGDKLDSTVEMAKALTFSRAFLGELYVVQSSSG